MASYSGDGVRVVNDDRSGRILRVLLVASAAVAVVTAVIIVAVRRTPSGVPSAENTRPATPTTPLAPAPTGPEARAPRAIDPHAEPVVRAVDRLRARRRAAAAAPEGARPELDARDVIPYLRSRGATTGIAAFEPPGTDPPKAGIVVPDDFPLPEGYVRHYQADDDGNQLPPILMFHPDYEFVDETGTPVALPDSGVVPPELAPHGLAIRMLDVPPPAAR